MKHKFMNVTARYPKLNQPMLGLIKIMLTLVVIGMLTALHFIWMLILVMSNGRKLTSFQGSLERVCC